MKGAPLFVSGQKCPYYSLKWFSQWAIHWKQARCTEELLGPDNVSFLAFSFIEKVQSSRNTIYIENCNILTARDYNMQDASSDNLCTRVRKPIFPLH